MTADRVADRFWQRTRQGQNGCIEWATARFPSGYGAAWFRGQTRRAHRVAWEITNGPIPAGLLVCHHCDNPVCVNPEHLFLGTPRDNMDDMARKGRAVRNGPNKPARGDRNASRLYPGMHRGEANGRAKVNAEQVLAIRAARESGETLARIGMAFGITDVMVSKIVRRVAWGHV